MSPNLGVIYSSRRSKDSTLRKSEKAVEKGGWGERENNRQGGRGQGLPNKI